ncbi:MAG: substrate-binding domain-containing protein [Thermoguttaceae bacterium]|jgi:ABC-type molybdate transport system substrate-binding protein|nr:substrate-binding domain-containing protein [Thermoguttaceae bacterium]
MHARTIVGVSATVLLVMVAALIALQWQTRQDRSAQRLVVYCAAGMQGPVQDAIDEYQRYYQQQHGRAVRIDVEYAGSGTLLSRLQVERTGDLYLAGDDSFIDTARQRGLVDESLPLAAMTPVIALAEGKADAVRSLQDLIDGDYRVGIGTPDGTAIGAATRAALKAAGQWEPLERKAEVTKPTVNDLAGDVKIGAIDAAIIWNVTARQFGLEYVTDDALGAATGRVEIGVLSSTRQPTAALHFARFLAAPEKGLRHFQAHHFDVVEGDRWADVPEVTFFSGGVNRRAMEPILEAFQQREGVRVNTVYQGCGALNAQMAAVHAQDPDHGFPDAYLACDVYYLSPVQDWFEAKATVSATPIVIVTKKGNPHNIQRLEDLAKPGLRIVVGHPTHCTIGGLTERLFKAEGLYEAIMPNVVEQQPSSGMMVPPVVSGAADASLAYYTDTLPERDRLHVVELNHDYARAVQPFGIASTSKHKHLMLRLYQLIGRSQEIYAELGFGWELGRSPDDFQLVAPAGARPLRIDRGDQR